MTITSLAPGLMQRRFPEVGRIRLGDKKNGHPNKLTKFRVTSSHADVLARIADEYGGSVTPWDDAPTGRGTQHQLYVESEHLDVMVPPGQVLTQAYELWSGGGCQRRCNGLAVEDGTPCVCPADPEERAALAQNGKACKLTTRLSVWLPKVPGIGVFRLESHGWYAGLELPGVAEILSMASEAGRPIPATLRIANRVVKRDGKTKQFIVPQLDPVVTVGTMLAIARGDEVPMELENTARPALAAPAAAAIGPAATPAPVVRLSEGAALVERVKELDDETRAEFKAWAAETGIRVTAKALDENETHRVAVAQWLDVMTRPEPATVGAPSRSDDDHEGRPF